MDNPRDDPARERRLARRRELYKLHRAAETSNQREERLARHREYMQRRRANIAAEERQALSQQRRKAYSREETIHPRSAVPLFDDPTVIAKLTEFYNHLFSL